MSLSVNVKKEKIGYGLLISLSVFVVVVILMIPPIHQNQSYHNFCDTMLIFGIPNFWNVISNLPFAIVGVLGLLNLKYISENKMQYVVFFASTVLVSIGSGYYHLNPIDSTLIWDRLPMTLVFMSLFSIIVSEFIDDKKGRVLLIPLISLGVISVLYWVVFGELKPYALVPFYPMCAIPIILIFFKSDYDKNKGYWLLLLAYIGAKLLEYYDAEVLEVLKVVSGHSLKHIIAAIGLFVLLYEYIKRKRIV